MEEVTLFSKNFTFFQIFWRLLEHPVLNNLFSNKHFRMSLLRFPKFHLCTHYTLDTSYHPTVSLKKHWQEFASISKFYNLKIAPRRVVSYFKRLTTHWKHYRQQSSPDSHYKRDYHCKKPSPFIQRSFLISKICVRWPIYINITRYTLVNSRRFCGFTIDLTSMVTNAS